MKLFNIPFKLLLRDFDNETAELEPFILGGTESG